MSLTIARQGRPFLLLHGQAPRSGPPAGRMPFGAGRPEAAAGQESAGDGRWSGIGAGSSGTARGTVVAGHVQRRRLEHVEEPSARRAALLLLPGMFSAVVSNT